VTILKLQTKLQIAIYEAAKATQCSISRKQLLQTRFLQANCQLQPRNPALPRYKSSHLSSEYLWNCCPVRKFNQSNKLHRQSAKCEKNMEERWQESRAQLTSCRRGTRCQILSATTHSLVGAVSILSARIAGHWPRFGTEQPSNDHASGVVQCPNGRFLAGRLEVPWRGGTPRGWDGMENLKSGETFNEGCSFPNLDDFVVLYFTDKPFRCQYSYHSLDSQLETGSFNFLHSSSMYVLVNLFATPATHDSAGLKDQLPPAMLNMHPPSCLERSVAPQCNRPSNFSNLAVYVSFQPVQRNRS
jgi:hypothetical protein